MAKTIRVCDGFEPSELYVDSPLLFFFTITQPWECAESRWRRRSRSSLSWRCDSCFCIRPISLSLRSCLDLGAWICECTSTWTCTRTASGSQSTIRIRMSLTSGSTSVLQFIQFQLAEFELPDWIANCISNYTYYPVRHVYIIFDCSGKFNQN